MQFAEMKLRDRNFCPISENIREEIERLKPQRMRV